MASETSGIRIASADRRTQCLELRLQGASYRAIGKAVGISGPGAYKHVRQALEAIREKNNEKADQLRTLEMLRLDRMMLTLWDRAVRDGDERAIDRVIKIMERRARLLGLDSPDKVDHTMKVTDEDRRRLVDQLTAEVVANAASAPRRKR